VKQPIEPSLIDSLPDLVLALSRDGILLSHGGGRALPLLAPREPCAGKRLESVFPKPVAGALLHLVRKSLAARTALETDLSEANHTYRARVTPQGPTRALCILSAGVAPGESEDAASASAVLRGPLLDRRSFMRRFQETLSLCVLTEKPLAVAVMHLDGIENLARIGARQAEQIVTAAVFKLLQGLSTEGLAQCACLGQLSESQLAFVITTSDRRAIEAFIAEAAQQVRTPSNVAGLQVELTPHAGVAVLDQDGSSALGLLDNARIAAGEARNSGKTRVRFFSDSVKMKSLSRLDIGRELRSAIEERAIGMRYVGRHDLRTGLLVARLAYIRWIHPLRGEVSPKEFLGVADATGAAVALSRAALQRLGADFAEMRRDTAPDVRLSFGPLRHHLLHEDFLADIDGFLASGVVAPGRLEIRIPESLIAVLSPGFCAPLVARGVQFVVDEVGRGLGSLEQLARAPLWGLQLDRAWVEAIQVDEIALRLCRAGIAAASGLGVAPIAVGVDDAAMRRALLSLGCHYGSGDLYRDSVLAAAQCHP
jgi:c-di-GMP-specific phosphodiesterase